MADKRQRRLKKLGEMIECMDTKSRAMFSRVFERLVTLNELLTESSAECIADFDKALRTFSHVIKEQDHYEALLRRLATNAYLVNQVYHAHMGVDRVYSLLGEEENPRLKVEWRDKWEEDRDHTERWLDNTIRKMSSENLMKDLDKGKDVEVFTIMGNQLGLVGNCCLEPTPVVSLSISKSIEELINSTWDRIAEKYKVLPKDSYSWLIMKSDLTYDKKDLQRTSYGSLYLGSWTNVFTGKFHDSVSVLRLDVDRKFTVESNSFAKSIERWMILDHPNIVKLHGANHGTNPKFIVCERLECNAFPSHDSANRIKAWQICAQLGAGLQHLHAKNMAHGHLNADNIFWTSDHVVKIALIGTALARRLSGSRSSTDRKTDDSRYKAPELLTDTSDDQFKSDIYSAGLCMLEALTGMPPFELNSEEEIIEKKFGDSPYDRPDRLLDDEWELISDMLLSDPSRRPNVNQVVNKIEQISASILDSSILE